MKLETLKPLNEGKILDWVKSLDKKLAGKVDELVAKYVAKQVTKHGLSDMTTEELGDDIGMMRPKSVKTMIKALEKYLEIEPEGKQADEVRHVLPSIVRNHKKWQETFASVGLGGD